MTHADLRDTFDRVVVINLRSQPARLARFYGSLPADWPFEKPVAFAAVDGRRVPMPANWQAGAAAWGCFRSHYQVLADALNDGVESLLVLEDDAICTHDFTRQTEAFMNSLPADWQWIYLGGQHIERERALPIRINESVYRPFNVHRAHAYGFRGRAVMQHVFRHLNEPDGWGWGKHVDHRLGELHKDYPGGVYVPAKWLIGQRAGWSNIKRKQLPANFFPDAQWLLSAPVDLPVVVVVGDDDISTSRVAGALHRLGVSMGDAKPKGTSGLETLVQDVSPGLAGVLDKMYSDPWWLELTNFSHRVALLRQWAGLRCRTAAGRRTCIGASHRLLGLMLAEISEAWNDSTILVVESKETKEKPATGWQQRQAGCLRRAFARLSVVENGHECIKVDAGCPEEIRISLTKICEKFKIQATDQLQCFAGPEAS